MDAYNLDSEIDSDDYDEDNYLDTDVELEREVHEEWLLSKVGLNRKYLQNMDEEDRNMVLTMHGLNPGDYYF